MSGDFARWPASLDCYFRLLPVLPSSRLQRPVLLIVGCGDIGLRVAAALLPRWRVLALTSSPQRMPALREAGVLPIPGDLDRPASLARLPGLADAVLHLAPPQPHGSTDRRTQALLHALARRGRVQRLVYVSTSGVYGDCGGARIDENRRLSTGTARAQRRADAEAQVRWFGRTTGARVTVLRAPGIYALDRRGGDPRERLQRGTPVLRASDDVYTNHIHADDLARACIAALYRGPTQRAVNVCDDSELKMGDYFDLAADLFGLPRPPRISRAAALLQMSEMQMSFMRESRRLDNRRMKAELRLVLRYPTVTDGLSGLSSRAVPDDLGGE